VSKSLTTWFFLPPCAFLLSLDFTFRLVTSSLLGLLSLGICSFHIDNVIPHLSGVNSALSAVQFIKRSQIRTGG